MNPADDLQPCLDKARESDPQAAAALVERLYPQVNRIVRSYVTSRLTEQDLAQEVFLKLFANLARYRVREGVPFEHWVSRLAVRVCLDALRAEKRRPELRYADLGDGEEGWLEFLLHGQIHQPPTEDSGAAELVHHLLGQLPPEQRVAVQMIDLEGLSVAEVRERTGWNASLIKIRAFRGRRGLRQLALRLKKSGRL